MSGVLTDRQHKAVEAAGGFAAIIDGYIEAKARITELEQASDPEPERGDVCYAEPDAPRCCAARSPAGHACTLPRGHAGRHKAGCSGGGAPLLSWIQTPAELEKLVGGNEASLELQLDLERLESLAEMYEPKALHASRAQTREDQKRVAELEAEVTRLRGALKRLEGEG